MSSNLILWSRNGAAKTSSNDTELAQYRTNTSDYQSGTPSGQPSTPSGQPSAPDYPPTYRSNATDYPPTYRSNATDYPPTYRSNAPDYPPTYRSNAPDNFDPTYGDSGMRGPPLTTQTGNVTPFSSDLAKPFSQPDSYGVSFQTPAPQSGGYWSRIKSFCSRSNSQTPVAPPAVPRATRTLVRAWDPDNSSVKGWSQFFTFAGLTALYCWGTWDWVQHQIDITTVDQNPQTWINAAHDKYAACYNGCGTCINPDWQIVACGLTESFKVEGFDCSWQATYYWPDPDKYQLPCLEGLAPSLKAEAEQKAKSEKAKLYGVLALLPVVWAGGYYLVSPYIVEPTLTWAGHKLLDKHETF